MEQQEVMRRFLVRYNECLNAKYEIKRWPDRENRRGEDIDVYAEAEDRRPLAIEHTSVESYIGQKRDSARFINVLGPLEEQLDGAFSFGVNLTVRASSIPTGVNWTDVQKLIRAWLLDKANQLPFGESRHLITGVPFELVLGKNADAPGKIWIARFAPPEEKIQVQVVMAVARALRHKYERLNDYGAAGAETVLILESDDIALVNEAFLYASFYLADRSVRTPGINQIWMAHTYVAPQDVLFSLLCFRGSQDLMRAANPPNRLIGRQHAPYWESVINGDPSLTKANEILVRHQMKPEGS